MVVMLRARADHVLGAPIPRVDATEDPDPLEEGKRAKHGGPANVGRDLGDDRLDIRRVESPFLRRDGICHDSP